jgi:hypothetical protein
MGDDGISSKGNNGEPEERSPRRTDGGSRLPPAKKLMHDAIRSGREQEGRRWSGHDEPSGSSHAKDSGGEGDTLSL